MPAAPPPPAPGYLDAGAKYGWMKGAVCGWYDGGNGVKRLAESPGDGRELYEALCRFIQGAHRPSGRVPLEDAVFIERDNRDKLAPASKGATIAGGVRVEGNPDLAPEQVLDGNIAVYGGSSTITSTRAAS